MSTLEIYKQTFETVVQDILSEEREKQIPQEILERLERMLRYSVPLKMEIRGLMVPMAYLELVGRTPTPENLHLPCILGWCWQIIMSAVINIDDIYDDTKYRFGKPTWSSLQTNKSIGINDNIMLERFTFSLLRKHCHHLPIYRDFVHIFSEFVQNFFMGQYLEMEPNESQGKGACFENISMQRYLLHVKLVNGGFPMVAIRLAILLAEQERVENKGEWNKNLEELCLEISYFWTLLDDYKDTYGISKEGAALNSSEDIRRGKCTWLLIKAKEVGKLEEWEILQKCYGRGDQKSVDQVRQIFDQLNIQNLCQDHMKCTVDQIKNKIKELSGNGSKIGKVFAGLLQNLKSYEK